MELLLLALVAGCMGLLMIHGLGHRSQHIAQLRACAEGQFRRTKVEDPTQGVSFDGSVASVIEAKEASYLADLLASNYVLTVSASMPDGTKYVFRSASNGKPWLSRLPQGNSLAVQVNVPFKQAQ